MEYRVDQKGKIYTQRITKEEIPAILATANHIIRGVVYVRPDWRLKDEMNNDERFIAITNAEVYDLSGQTRLYKNALLVMNKAQLAWIMPQDEEDDFAIRRMTVNNPGPYLREPTSIEETGLSFGFLADLTLKVIYFANEITGQGVADHLKLPFARIVETLLGFLIRDDLLTITGSSGFGERAYKYAVTKKGNSKVQELLARCQYAGPAPVALEVSNALTRHQSIGEVRVTRAQVQEGFRHLVIAEELLARIGPAVNSARSAFFYGPPGNGKTVIAEGIAKLLGGTAYIPYAVEVDGQVIKVFDAVNHRPLPPPAVAPPGFGSGGDFNRSTHAGTTTVIAHDQRWVHCQRPFIVVGGELTLAGLDLVFDPIAKIYEAPFQMKANGGMFLIDDFGRQQVSPRDLLNRWIVPLEKRLDYLTLQTGKKIEVPFDVLIVFSTNLDPTALVDDAFLRRIRHKILVPDPTWAQFRELFRRLCQQRNVTYDSDALEYLIQEHYIKAGRTPKMVHPRDLLDQVIDVARYLDIPPAMSNHLLDQAVAAYFVKL